MRIVVHDYSGHPFQVQLSRALASRGHEVLHLYSLDFLTPKGRVDTGSDDPSNLIIKGITTGVPIEKRSLFKRRAQERVFGQAIGREIRSFSPEVVVSSNAPLDCQAQIASAAEGTGAAFVFWVQDLYGEAISRILRQRLGILGLAIGTWYKALEYRLLRASDGIVVISEDFVPILSGHGIAANHISVIENWAPLDEMPLFPKREDDGQERSIKFVYSGTLGYKHNPDLLLAIAEQLEAPVTVYSEGITAEELSLKAEKAAVHNLAVRGWVPFEQLPAVLGSYDVLIVMIEPDAGVFSVPSKVLTYFCVGRPILAAIPLDNLAARLIIREDAGLVSPPGDADRLIQNARKLAADSALRARMGASGRSYAERTFEIGPLATRFEDIIKTALRRFKTRAQT